MTQAGPMEHADKIFIGGEWELPSSDRTIDVINSGTEELFAQVAEAQSSDVGRAVAAAREAFDHGPWPQMSHAERAVYLRSLSKELEKHASDIGRIWTTESGLIHSLADPLASTLGSVFDFYADQANTFPFIEKHDFGTGGGAAPVGAAGSGWMIREPVGVVAAIIPWNGPALMIAYKCAPALIAGCTIVLKVSPEAPGAGYKFAEACKDAGLPAGVVNVIMADREVSEELVRHPGVDKVTFTGSTTAGRRVGSICGERIARCTLELGGKSAAVVMDDFDAAEAAQIIAGATTFLTGQACSLLTRIIVNKSRHDELVDALSANLRAIKVGDPFDPETQMGPLAHSRHRERVESYIATGKAEGALLATGGQRPASLNRGFFIEPTVFANVTNDMTIAREEIFGPVLSVIKADDEAHAIRIANDTIYGLNASVFTHDNDRFLAAARQLRSGTVGHNGYHNEFRIAFGGFKQSGIGREGGTEGLHPFLETKTVVFSS